ncbi:MAG: peptidoglycan-binding protein [Candidatus Sericytochromatia bacterium]|nr:peptidoglycan-binding protein [Candidatus Sericytochromatia bacterium]
MENLSSRFNIVPNLLKPLHIVNNPTVQNTNNNSGHHSLIQDAFTSISSHFGIGFSPIMPLSLFRDTEMLQKLPDEMLNQAPSISQVKNGATIGKGSKGQSVSQLQSMLTKMGFPVQVTGEFGATTERVLKKFQQSFSIEQTGKLGATTLKALQSGLKSVGDSTAKNFASLNRFLNPSTASSHHFYQYDGSASQRGNCGPSSARVTLEAITGKKFSINQIRQAAGVTSPRDGAWAIDESELKNAIENLSGGSVKRSGSASFDSRTSLVNYLKSELAKGHVPILMTGNNSGSGGGHYTTVSAIEKDGSILVVDSAKPRDENGGISRYSPADLSRRISQLQGSTTVSSFAPTSMA